MKADDYIKKLFSECEENQDELCIIVKNSLARLTKNYSGEALEEMICKIIKRYIFAYVYIPEYTDELLKIHSGEWRALTPSEFNWLISNPNDRFQLDESPKDHSFNIDSLWV